MGHLEHKFKNLLALLILIVSGAGHYGQVHAVPFAIPGLSASIPRGGTCEGPGCYIIQARVKLNVGGSSPAKLAKNVASKGLETVASPLTRAATEVGRISRKLAENVRRTLRAELIRRNALEGRMREVLYEEHLRRKYPGADIRKQVTVRDQNGKRAIEDNSNMGRRHDFVVYKDNKIVDIIEVTSPSASKIKQQTRDIDLRDQNKDYLPSRDGKSVHRMEVEPRRATVDLNNGAIND